MNIVTVDFETYYDKEYSLRKLTTEEYIRSPKFEIIGVSLKVNDQPAYWRTDIAQALSEIDWENSAALAHNAVFDGAIMSWHFNIKPKLWLDTLSMARVKHLLNIGVSLDKLSTHYMLGTKGLNVHSAAGKHAWDFTPEELADYGAYCVNDVELTYKLFNRLKVDFPRGDYAVIDQLIRMFTEPMFELDIPMLEQHLVDIKEKKRKLLDAVGDLAASWDEMFRNKTTKEILMSNDMFARLLKASGVEPPMKVSKTTHKLTYAFAKTDKEFTDLQEHPNPFVQALVSARLGVKSTLEETRTQSFIEIAKRGPLPIMLKYWGAHTGRLSGDDGMNLQNLPRGGVLRKALKAPYGHSVITADLAQIEARLVAYVAGQDDLVQAFAEGRDVYLEFAEEVYGRKLTALDKLERFIGKTGILQLGYQSGAPKFRAMLALGSGGVKHNIDEYEAQRIVGVYRSRNHKIASLWQRCQYALRDMVAGNQGRLTDTVDIWFTPDGLELPGGVKLMYPELSSNGREISYQSRRVRTKIYGGKTTENIMQALAALLIREYMAKLRGVARVVLQVHDEIVMIVPNDKVATVEAFVKNLMSTPPSWAINLPVKVEVGIGDRYGTAK